MNSQLAGLKQTLTTPLIADLMTSRAIGLSTLAAVGIHGGLVAAGLPGWQCPFRHLLGVPCPGCGLSRAIEALLRGDWDTALAYHAFAPLVLLALVLIIGASLLPRRPRRWLIEFLAGLERRLGVGAIGLVAMVVYWLARLVFFSESYLALIMN
jgi:hypothetical protein